MWMLQLRPMYRRPPGRRFTVMAGWGRGSVWLIHGAAGAVGAFAVQFARYTEAEVYATAAGRDRDFVLSLGADVFIDYRTEDFAAVARDMDLVIDLVGGDTLARSYGVVRPGGRLVTLVGKAEEELARECGIEAVSMGVEPTPATWPVSRSLSRDIM